jgi:hypothetical protein
LSLIKIARKQAFHRTYAIKRDARGQNNNTLHTASSFSWLHGVHNLKHIALFESSENWRRYRAFVWQ